jgi:hypothetical protein
MGDVLSLIERAEKVYDRSQAEALQKKLRRNDFDLEDFREQLRAVKKMGSMTELLGMIPGVKKLLRGADSSGAEDELKRTEAIIDSMTRAERRNVQILNASRRKRIAKGSGTSVAEVNRLIKQFTPDEEGAEAARLGPDAEHPGAPRPPPLIRKGDLNGSEDPPRPTRQQEEARVPHRRRATRNHRATAVSSSKSGCTTHPIPHPHPVSSGEAGRVAEERRATDTDGGAAHPAHGGRPDRALIMTDSSRSRGVNEGIGAVSRQTSGEPPGRRGSEGDAG